MSLKMFGIILLFVGSEALGLFSGRSFYNLMMATMPPIGMSALNRGAAGVAFTTYGAIGGLIVFVWALIAIMVSPLFRSKPAAQPAPATASPPPAKPA
jgi:hypothetical protein